MFNAKLEYRIRQSKEMSKFKNDISKMNRKELVSISKNIFSTANRRLSKLERLDVLPPAVQSLYKKHGIVDSTTKSVNLLSFRTRGLDEQELRRSLIEAKSFLQAQTSTLSGVGKWRKNLRQEFMSRMEDMGVSRDVAREVATSDQFWTVYNRLIVKKEIFDIRPQLNSDQLQADLSSYMINIDFKNLSASEIYDMFLNTAESQQKTIESKYAKPNLSYRRRV